MDIALTSIPRTVMQRVANASTVLPMDTFCSMVAATTPTNIRDQPFVQRFVMVNAQNAEVIIL